MPEFLGSHILYGHEQITAINSQEPLICSQPEAKAFPSLMVNEINSTCPLVSEQGKDNMSIRHQNSCGQNDPGTASY